MSALTEQTFILDGWEYRATDGMARCDAFAIAIDHADSGQHIAEFRRAGRIIVVMERKSGSAYLVIHQYGKDGAAEFAVRMANTHGNTVARVSLSDEALLSEVELHDILGWL